jgi:hypothetical protein
MHYLNQSFGGELRLRILRRSTCLIFGLALGSAYAQVANSGLTSFIVSEGPHVAHVDANQRISQFR